MINLTVRKLGKYECHIGMSHVILQRPVSQALILPETKAQQALIILKPHSSEIRIDPLEPFFLRLIEFAQMEHMFDPDLGKKCRWKSGRNIGNDIIIVGKGAEAREGFSAVRFSLRLIIGRSKRIDKFVLIIRNVAAQSAYDVRCRGAQAVPCDEQDRVFLRNSFKSADILFQGIRAVFPAS